MGKISVVLVVVFSLLVLAGCLQDKKETETQDATPGVTTDKGGDTADIQGGKPGDDNKAWSGNAKDFSYKKFGGGQGKLSDYAGKPLVLNFWAVWCPPCVGEMPEFNEVYEARKGQFEMLGICVDNTQNPEQFVQTKGFSYDFGFDVDGYSKYGKDAIPVTVFIDRQGNVTDVHTGSIDKVTFEASLQKIL